MDQISASVYREHQDGYAYMVTEYVSSCGCNWKVDQWGNVRKVKVCHECLEVPMASEYQIGLFSQTLEYE